MKIYKVVVSAKDVAISGGTAKITVRMEFKNGESIKEQREQISAQEEKCKRMLLDIGFSHSQIKVGKTARP